MNKTPTVTLVMPNYNYSAFVGQAIESVVNQTYKDFELILIDDCSTDNSLEVIKPYLDKYTFIRFIAHEKNQGVYASFAEGARLARGKYITFPSSDDILLPSFLEKNVRFFEQNPELGLTFSRFTTFESHAPDIHYTTSLQKSYPEQKLSGEDLIYRAKMNRMWIPGNTILVKREYFMKYGGYDPQFGSLTDWFLFYKIGFLHGCYFIPETLALLRTHQESHSKTEQLDKKHQAWKNIISSLSKKENKQLKRAFIRSHAFNSQGYEFFDFILKRPKYWWFFKQYTYKHFYKRWKKHKQIYG